MALSDLMNSFKTAAQPNNGNPNNAPVPAGNIPPNAATTGQSSEGTAPNGTIPTGTENSATNDGKEVSPLDDFSKLWETDPNANKADEFGILGEINPAKIQEVAGKINFASVVDKKDVELIKAGGDEAMAALGRALNKTSQAVFAQSAVATSKLIETATSKMEQKIDETLAAKIKSHTFSDSLRQENPAYSHPAAAPLVKMIETQIAAKYPNATTAELKDMAQQYFTRTFSAISGEDAKKANAAKANPEYDWEKEFGFDF